MAALSAFEQLLHAHAGAGIQKQLRLSEEISGLTWEIDFQEGLLGFFEGPRLVRQFEVQVLGTVAHGRWLWAWANPSQELSESLKQAAQSLRKLGGQFEVEELTRPMVELGDRPAGELALVASGTHRAVGYFCVPLEHSELYCLLTSPRLPEEALPASNQVAEIFPLVLEQVELRDPRLAFIHLLRFHRMRIEQGPSQVRGLGRSGDRIEANFDRANRFFGLRTFGS